MTENGFVLLVEAMMEQAYKDAQSTDEAVRNDAETYINEMKERYGNM